MFTCRVAACNSSAAVFSMRDNAPLQGVSAVELKVVGKGVSKTAAYDGKYL